MNNPAKTPAQQKLFAIALGIKKGQISRSYSSEAAKMADRMSERKLREFAETRFKNPKKSSYGHSWRKVVFYDTHNIGYQCRRCGDWRLKGETGDYPCSGYPWEKRKLQKNLLPEIGAAMVLGIGAGLGYKTAGKIWKGITGEKKNPVDEIRWQGLCCRKCGSLLIIAGKLKKIMARNYRSIEYHCEDCGHSGEFYFKVVRHTNPGESYHTDRAAMFRGLQRSGVASLKNKAKLLAENEEHNVEMSRDLGMNPLHPGGQTCPKCGKVYHDDKWGGCGICSCGYYFYPEWYNMTRAQADKVYEKGKK